MQTPLYVGLSGQLALRRQLDVVANNVANMNTVGFRAENSLFAEHLAKAEEGRKVAFVVDRATYTDMRMGAFEKTGNDFDVAIRGDGWLQVETPQGIRYTRDGRLNMDPDGMLVTVNGEPVLGADGQSIQIPEDAARIDIRKDGTIVEGDRVFGRIGVVRLDDLATMEREANGLYRTAGEPQPADGAQLLQGMVETSNVQPIVAMTELITLSRAYQQAAEMVDNAHSVERKGIDKLGKIS
ncbi:flagellar basal-body rod protein FlgF [Rhodospirillaceae bacterium SYSU D60014]|uniref:flagellar basal-body rod protein FlgF n=1 Tax=Virgifigura deserti TaxID=2268457 RepID=UPI000E667140